MKLGDLSPLAGIATGEGLMGKLSAAGGIGLLPAIISRKAQERREEEEARNAENEQREEKKREKDSALAASTGMKNGGKVSSASSRADGCATKGKTKGRFV
jgi:hypothetical protein